ITRLSDSPDPSSAARTVLTRGVGEDFLEIFGIELLAGRALGEHADDWPAPAPAASGAANGQAPSEPRSGAAGGNGTAGSAGGSSASGSGTPAAGTAPPANQAPPRQRNIVVDRAFVESF